MQESIWAETALLPGGWADHVAVTIEHGLVTGTQAGQAPHGMRVGCLLPAPVNLHSHTFQRAIAGLTERRGPGADSFWTWRERMYAFLTRMVPEDVQAVATMAMVEMAEAGYGAMCEFHYLHHAPDGAAYGNRAELANRIVAAAEATGMGLTLLPVLYMQGGCDGRELTGGQLRFGNDVNGLSRILDSVTGMARDGVLGVAPHSLRAVPPAAMVEVTALRPGAPVHIHAAEQVAEVAEVQSGLGARPVQWLLDHGADARWCLIHATQMEPDETEGLARSGAVAGLCPVTEANLGDGIFDGARFRRAGGMLGVGTDSNVLISLTEELRVLEYAQRLALKARGVMADPGQSVGRSLYDAVLAGGARAAGRRTGAIAKGNWADLVALDTGALALAERQGDALLDSWIFAAGQSVVSDLWSAGRHVVRGGRHVTRDAAEAGFRRAIKRLMA